MIIITGPIHSGKTTLLIRLAQELEGRGIHLQGFLSIAAWDKGQAFGYDLFNLEKKTSLPFIRKEGEEGWERIGAYFFLPSGLSEAKRIIDTHSSSHWLVVDEIGPLELAEKGLWPALKHLFTIPTKNFLCVVRTQILDTFLLKIAHPDSIVLDVKTDNLYSILLEKMSIHSQSE